MLTHRRVMNLAPFSQLVHISIHFVVWCVWSILLKLLMLVSNLYETHISVL